MIRFKHSPRWRYRKCYCLLLSTLSVCLIILYCLIFHKQTLMLSTLLNNNANYNYNNDSSSSNNNNNNIANNRSNSISKNILRNFTKKHVVDSNNKIRERLINTESQRIQVTHDQPSTSTKNRSSNQQQEQQLPQPSPQNAIHQPQDTNFSLVASKFGQMAITNSTYNLKMIENKNNINNKTSSESREKKEHNDNKQRLQQLTGFNVQLSDSLPLQRLIPDTRHQSCKSKLYSKQLPQCSIIIIYYNEHATVLLRTLHTLIYRTSKELLKEIVLVDDCSDSKTGFQEQLRNRFPVIVKLISLPRREGLIRARLRGARAALGEVLVFLDAHVEVNKNWLPPLLAPILENEQTCTTPIIDVIKYDTFEYQAALPSRGGFNWEFNYVELPLRKEELALQPWPHSNPIMNGGLFAIRREYFWHLGGYDEGLEIWGAEQFELSFKIWLCGGRLLEVPCSRVGHLYRDPNYRVNYTSRKDDFISRNYKRVAEVWLDEYKEYLYEHMPKLNRLEPGDLSQQKLLRAELKCKPFKWFFENIAPDLLKAYPPVKPSDFALGAIQSLALPELCIDLASSQSRHILENVLKPCSPDLKYPYASQKFHLTFRHDLRHKGNCLEVQNWVSHAPVWLWPCHNSGGNQYWFYDRNTQMLIQGKTDHTQRCLEVDSATLRIFVNYCHFFKREQKWHMGYVNQTAMEHFFEA